MTENIAAARSLLPGADWVPYLVSAAPLLGGYVAGRLGERRSWLVVALWTVAMMTAWGAFNPLGGVQWALGALGLSAAGWAAGGARPSRGGTSRSARRARLWMLGPPLVMAAALIALQDPRIALILGCGGTHTLLDYATARAADNEPDEAIVFGEAAVDIATGQGRTEEVAEAEVVTASLFAAEGDCTTAVLHARVAHLTLGSDLPRLDEAIRECFATHGP